MEKQVQGLAAALVAIIVLVIGTQYYFAQTPTILSAVSTHVYNASGDGLPGGPLENLDANSKQVAGVIPIFYILGGMVFIVGGAFGLYKFFSNRK